MDFSDISNKTEASMIYVNTKSGQTVVLLPKNTSISSETYDLAVYSQGTNKTYGFTGLTDTGYFKDFYTFTLDLTDLQDGEWEYSISNGDKGMMTIGKPGIDHYEYNKDEKHTYYERK